jgi:hypothetical protein
VDFVTEESTVSMVVATVIMKCAKSKVVEFQHFVLPPLKRIRRVQTAARIMIVIHVGANSIRTRSGLRNFIINATTGFQTIRRATNIATVRVAIAVGGGRVHK